MKHIFIKCRLLCLLAFMSISAFAQPISKEEAQLKAQQFFGKANQSRDGRGNAPRTAPLLTLVNNCDEFYIFNDEANGGYVIVSGDERMPDILGYSYDGHFDTENVPCNMEALLKGYVDEVRYVQTHEVQKKRQHAAQKWEIDYIAPLLSTTWDQREPYNNHCPTFSGEHCVTGCVATAMAQLMAFHKWPQETTAYTPAYRTETHNIRVEAIPPIPIDWENMLNSYSFGRYSNQQANAVADLMMLCGASVQMDYGLTESGASTSDAAMAFGNYFGFNAEDIEEIFPNEFTDFDFEHILYDELDSKRPVIYTANSSSEGHAMVIDGFEGNGKQHYFHVNFGWGGQNDGYYLLSNVPIFFQPSSAIIGIQPLKPESPWTYGVLDDGQLTLYYDNKHESRSGKVIPSIKKSLSDNKKITKCVIDPSIKRYTPYSLSSLFKGCSDLKEIVGLGNINTSLVTSMDNMFYGCSSLTSLDLSGFKTDNVTAMHNMFRGCSSLTSLDLSGFKTDKVTDMGCMFYGCSSLTSLDLSGFKTDKVTDMGCMFYGCSSLTSLDLSSFKTNNVVSMSWMFYGCSSLTSLDLSGFKTDKVTNMAYMFYSCSSLTSLDLSNFDTNNVTNVDGMFQGCKSLMYIIAGDKWSTSKVSSGKDMFYNCYELTGGSGTQYGDNHIDYTYACIDGGIENPGYFTSVGAPLPLRPYAVLNDDNTVLTFYCDDQRDARNGMKIKPIQWTDNKSTIATVVFDPSFVNCLVTSTAQWFSDCNNLTNIIGIENLITSNVTNTSYMFSGCSSLTNLDLSGFKTDKVTDMSSMFSGCSSLTNLDLSGFNTDKVTYMGSMFSGCSSLTNLDLSGFNTDKVTYMGSMFSGCSSLTSLDLSGFKTDKVTYMGSMFFGCSSLTSLDLSSFKTNNVVSMSWMFNGCSSLTSFDLSSFNTDKVTNMGQMFRGCSSLTSLDLSSFKTDNVTMMTWMFLGCYKLSSIYVSEKWNTNNVGNADDMFGSCTRLIGGAGTQFNWNHIGLDYAHIDGGPENPGYLTYKENTNAINTLLSKSSHTNIYDLQGIKLNGIQKGFNIINGKKIMLR